MSKHTHTHSTWSLGGCAWQTQKAEKEFKGNVLARGVERRAGRDGESRQCLAPRGAVREEEQEGTT